MKKAKQATEKSNYEFRYFLNTMLRFKDKVKMRKKSSRLITKGLLV